MRALGTQSEVGHPGGTQPAHTQSLAGLASALGLAALSVSDPEVQGSYGYKEPQARVLIRVADVCADTDELWE